VSIVIWKKATLLTRFTLCVLSCPAVANTLVCHGLYVANVQANNVQHPWQTFVCTHLQICNARLAHVPLKSAHFCQGTWTESNTRLLGPTHICTETASQSVQPFFAQLTSMPNTQVHTQMHSALHACGAVPKFKFRHSSVCVYIALKVNYEFVWKMLYTIMYIHVVFFLLCSPHPYLFFNDDGNSFTFMGFIINVQTGDILDPHTRETLTPKALPRQLHEALIRNRVNLSENFDELPRQEPFPVLSFLLASSWICCSIIIGKCWSAKKSLWFVQFSGCIIGAICWSPKLCHCCCLWVTFKGHCQRCRLAYGPADATATHYLLLQ